MASPNIQFDTIPVSIRKPGKYFEFNTRLAVRTLPGNPQSLLIIAQQTGTEPCEPRRIFDADTAGLLFGFGSQIHSMVLTAMHANPYLELTVLPLADPESGLPATAVVTPSGEAQSAGVVSITIAGKTVSIALAKDDTPSECAVTLAQAVNLIEELPVVASVTESGVLTLTAKHKGTCGNGITVSVQSSVPGMKCTLTPMQGGQGEPDFQAALAKVFSGDYAIYCVGTTQPEHLKALSDHLESMGAPLEQRGAIGVYALTGTLEDAITLATATNSGRLTGAVLPGSPSLSYEVAASYAAIIASEEDPARPLNGLTLKGISPSPISHRLSRTQQEAALKNGVTPLEVGAGEAVSIVRAISTYTKNSEGSPDSALLDITTIRTLDYVRKAIRERMSLRFPREKLSTRTLPKVRSEVLDVLRKMEELEILEEVASNAEGVIVERDIEDPNRLNARIPADVVNGLHIFAGKIDLIL